MLQTISARQAKEWELFFQENLDPLDLISIQLARIASIFANAFIKRKDGKSWGPKDFVPQFEKPDKSHKNDIVSSALSLAGIMGDQTTKEKVKKRFKEGVIGTDGRRYKYKLEQFIKKPSGLPKRLRDLKAKGIDPDSEEAKLNGIKTFRGKKIIPRVMVKKYKNGVDGKERENTKNHNPTDLRK